MSILPLAVVVALVGASGGSVSGQAETTKTGKIERVVVHGRSLEGNLIGDSPDRHLSVYLPPDYGRSPGRRFPVIYMLHGFTDSDAKWFGLAEKHWINLPEVLDRSLARSDVSQMIVVMPDAFTTFQGSMYSSSVTIGDWERFVAEELVAYVDSHYRTIPDAASRGLAGHSMGGYGTLRIGMKYPRVFSSLYALSPCCLPPPSAPAPTDGKQSATEEVKTVEQIAKAGFRDKALLASAAAWSPNPTNPPLYLDLPTRDGQVRPDVVAQWSANAPLAMVHQYVFNLKALKAIAFDAGTEDRAIHASSVELDQVLTNYKLPHVFGSYEGDHLNRIAERIETLLMPFFSKHLVSQP